MRFATASRTFKDALISTESTWHTYTSCFGPTGAQWRLHNFEQRLTVLTFLADYFFYNDLLKIVIDRLESCGTSFA